MTVTLAAVGLYGMLAQFVAQRRREIGVRMALGAPPAQVLSQLLGFGASLIAIGVAIGLAGAFGLARFMATLVFQHRGPKRIRLGNPPRRRGGFLRVVSKQFGNSNLNMSLLESRWDSAGMYFWL